MDKKLPKVFANPLREVRNNDRVYYSSQGKPMEEEKDTRPIAGKTIQQKINAIFQSTNYIYKAEVDITLDSGKVRKKIIGKNRNHLITMDNELISIDSIRDIEYVNR